MLGIKRLTKQEDSLPHWKVLLYGKRGSGKTHLAATANDVEELGPALHIMLEPTKATLEERGDVDYIQPPSVFEANNPTIGTEDYVPSIEALMDAQLLGNEELGKYKTWIIDSVTELEEMNLEAIRTGKAKNAMLELQDYGKNTNGLIYVFRRLRDLPVNVYFLALEEDIIVGGGQNAVPKGVRPALTKKLAKKIMGYVDYIHYLYVDEQGNRWLYTNPTTKIEAKTRGPSFATRLENQLPSNPTLSDVVDIYYDRFTPPTGNE